MIKTRPQKKTTSQLIKELDDIFSLFVRLRDCNHQGIITCFITGERIYYKDADAAHFIDRAHMATRWDENNVHSCTQDTNRYDPHHKEKYRIAMDRRYGMFFVDGLWDLSRSLAKFTAFELMEKISYYKEKVAELKRVKAL